MAVLLGITNGSTQDVQQVYKRVQHRGKDGLKTGALHQHFIASAKNETDLTIQQSSGLFQDKNLIVAIAGAITSKEEYRPLSPEDIAELYRKHGLDEMLHLIQGAYVLAILNEQQLHLVRDATGQRTIYYHQGATQFSFCIEPKGIHALPSFSPELNIKAIFQYFSYSFIPMHETMLKGIKELPAGYYLTHHLRSKQTTTKRFFQLETFDKHHLEDLDYWVDRVRRNVQQEVDDKLKGQEDVGVFLSGGLDSSIVAAQVAQRHHKKVHTFSIHFGKQYLNELAYAKMLAERYNTVHHEVEIRPKDFIPHIRKTIWHLDDPIGDPITIPNFELAKYASNYVPVIFNGEGSDPCFGGPKNIPMLLGHWYGGVQRTKNFREKAYLASYKRGYKHLQQLLSPELLAQFDEEEHLESILVPFFAEPKLNFLDKLMSINIRLKGAHLILPKVERMLGAAALPAIAPFFTEEIVRTSMEMPSNFKLHKGIEKYILKKAFSSEIPPDIINRPKSGMRVPVRYWFQGEMRRYKHKILNPKTIKKTGIFNPATIKDLLKYRPERGLERHGLLTWMVMTFEIWRQLFIEKQDI
ncbi:MAG: asparagine synthase-related protein [Saprospiraceae bacterium]|nr:asparagine synthase-related protein [Saprospiraceae bacterium]